jgi:hypothetical protein
VKTSNEIEDIRANEKEHTKKRRERSEGMMRYEEKDISRRRKKERK